MKGGGKMEEIKKLSHLIHHWKEHNDEHAEGYRQWAERVKTLGNKELFNILIELYEETKKIGTLFEKAREEVRKYEGGS